MKQYNFVKIDENEWRFISALEESNSISEISKKLRLPYITVYRTYKQLKDRADLFFSINFQKMNLLPVYLFFDNDTNITHVNEFVVSIRQVYGIKPYKIVYALVPYVYLNNFIKIFFKFLDNFFILTLSATIFHISSEEFFINYNTN